MPPLSVNFRGHEDCTVLSCRLALRCTGYGAATCCVPSAVRFRVRLQSGELGSVRRSLEIRP
jgi:hypothetical protein